jgi:hypothetical protein
MAAFMRGGVSGYTADPRFQRGPRPSPELQAPFSFGGSIQPKPFDYGVGANFQVGPFELGLTAQRYKPHFGGSLMFRQRIPF